jgi:hypothetical protein
MDCRRVSEVSGSGMEGKVERGEGARLGFWSGESESKVRGKVMSDRTGWI